MDQADIDKEIKVDNEMWEEVRLFQQKKQPVLRIGAYQKCAGGQDEEAGGRD